MVDVNELADLLRRRFACMQNLIRFSVLHQILYIPTIFPQFVQTIPDCCKLSQIKAAQNGGVGASTTNYLRITFV